MARLRRILLADHAHHVLLIGHNRQSIVLDDEDRRRLLDLLRDVTRTQRVDVHAWALLPSELHLLLTPPTPAALSAAMQALARRHTAAFNRRHGRSGTLWSDRFRASALQPGGAVQQAMLYIEILDREAASETAPLLGSSLAHHLGQVRDPMIVECPSWWRLGNTPFDREASWRAAIDQGLGPEQAQQIHSALRRGWPRGKPDFLQALQAQTGQPVRPRPRGRPRRPGTDPPPKASS